MTSKTIKTAEEVMTDLEKIFAETRGGLFRSSDLTRRAEKITETFGIPSSYSEAVAQNKTAKAAAPVLVRSLRSMSPKTKVKGRIEQLIEQTQTDDLLVWATKLANELHADYLLPKDGVRPLFNIICDPGNHWKTSLAETLSKTVLRGPKMAAFVLSELEDGTYACATRPVEKGEGIGLPGGKVDPGETLREAALREAHEEGWAVEDLLEDPLHVELIGQHICVWFQATSPARELSTFKEQHRISTVRATHDELHAAGMGNDNALLALAEGRSEDALPSM